MRARAFLLAACAIFAMPTLAMAQSRGDAAAAEMLFRSAKEATKKGDFAVACPQFAESARLDRAPGTLLNLADCEEHIGRFASAWAHFVEAADAFPSRDARITYAQKRADAALKRAAKLTLAIDPAAPRDLQVWRGDMLVGAVSLGRPLPVDPGEHVLRVRSAEGREQRQTIRLAEGESKEVVLRAPSAPTAPTAASPPAKPIAAPTKTVEVAGLASPPPDSGGTRTAGYVVGGIGIAALAVGGVTGIMALGRASTYKDHCDAAGCDDEGMNAASSGKTLATLSTVGVAAGVIGVGVGAFLILNSSKTTRVSAAPHGSGGMLRLSHEF